MPITPEQREQRTKHLGSSDMAAILGMNPWKSPADVWAEKVHGTRDITSPAIELGNMLEPLLLKFAEQELGKAIRENVSIVHKGGILAANLDGLVEDEKAVIEAKSTGLVDDWGEAGTDQVPDYVNLQVHHQMECCGAEVAYIPVMLFRFRPVTSMYVVERNNELCDAIREQGEEWWNTYVVPKIPPPDTMPSLDTMRRVIRAPGAMVPIDDELVEEWLAARDAAKSIKAAEEKAKARILHAMGDAEIGESSIGTFTARMVKRKEYTVKATEYLMTRFKEHKNG